MIKELQSFIDRILRKDFKKYQISKDIGVSTRKALKEALLGSIGPGYQKYLKTVKPDSAYNMEDIELSVDKLLKLT
jgi:hypothetical protein